MDNDAEEEGGGGEDKNANDENPPNDILGGRRDLGGNGQNRKIGAHDSQANVSGEAAGKFN